MTSGDGQKDGKDTNGVPYIKYLMDYYVNKVEPRIASVSSGPEEL